MKQFHIKSIFLLREPTRSLDKLLKLNMEVVQGGSVIFDRHIRRLFSQPYFREAIYLTSQNLYQELSKWLNDKDFDAKREERLTLSLYKYLIRMSSRSTPYGLFAGCAMGKISEQPTSIDLDSHHHKHARLDMNALAEIIDALLQDPIIRAQIKFRPNSSLYVTDTTYRYVTYILRNKQRSYRLSSSTITPYINRILALAQSGKCKAEFVKSLVELEGEFTEEEAIDYVEKMIALQILVSELTPGVTGSEGLSRLIRQLEHLQGTESYVFALQAIEKLLSYQENTIDQYAQIESIINQHFTKISGKNLVQVDLHLCFRNNNIQRKPTEQLVSNMEKLLPLATYRGSVELDTFRKKFIAKFGEQKVPLAIALDSDLGVGYGLHTSGISDHMPLLESTKVPEKRMPASVQWSPLVQLKMRKIREALSDKKQITSISDRELKELGSRPVSSDAYPDSMYLLGTILAGSSEDVDRGQYEFLFKALSGPSAANLMGRFCHGNTELNTELQSILQEERSAHSEKIYAEIVHLPQARTGNVLLRPTIGEYEIPYLGGSSVSEDYQIPINDLIVSCSENNILLQSKRFNKEVIPRLTTAHNFSRGLPVYKFLCDMQLQDKIPGVTWRWYPFEKEPFLPRIIYKNIIVSRARWYLFKTEYASLLDNKKTDLLHAFSAIRARLHLPRYVALVAGDNELLLDLECLPALTILKEKLLKSNVILLEFLQTPDRCLVSDKKGHYTHEVIIPLQIAKHKKDKQTASERAELPHPAIQRSFTTGSEWLYAKIYTGNKNADRILAEVIKPLTEQMEAQNTIEQWFFIRYADPDHHLRVRFHHCENPTFWKTVLEQLHERLAPYLQKGIIHKVQTDTYQREIERYGHSTMTLSEQLFYFDSEAVVNFIDLIDGAEGERYRWLFALRGVDELLNDFGYTIAQKNELLQQLQRGFFQEHHGNDALRHSLNDKYRANRQAITEILDSEKDTEYIMPAVDCFRTRSARSQATIATIQERCSQETEGGLSRLLPSYIHMFLNRMFLSQPRRHELVIYHYLMKYYDSQVARDKKRTLLPHQKALTV